MKRISRLQSWLQQKATCISLAALLGTASCTPPAPVGSGQWLLSGLERLTDEGDLFDPGRFEQILNLHVAVPSPKELYKQPADCSNPSSGRSLISAGFLTNPDWFKPTTQGVQNMLVPAFGINPGGVFGDQKLSYTDSTWRPCSEKSVFLAAERNSELTISGLPAFACYQRRDLELRFGVKDRLATDGVDIMSYTVADHDQRSASLTFQFRFGAPCALSARLSQGPTHGNRYKRARIKWQRCRENLENHYTRVHGPMNISDENTTYSRINATMATCGTLDSYYNRQPA